uniref:Uncharacterized protein n=1 Tax=Trichobilharzia regenti TaxID=157069 RepID=A0AA85K1F6_TRIRE|nr:unnamed protein product [Trichobilharzia regenti]
METPILKESEIRISTDIPAQISDIPFDMKYLEDNNKVEKLLLDQISAFNAIESSEISDNHDLLGIASFRMHV